MKKTNNKLVGILLSVILLLLVVVLIFSFSSFRARAAEYLPKDMDNSGNVVVDQEYRNLYVGGGAVVVNENVFGDLFAVGGSVNLAGEVEEDFLALAGNVTVSNPVGGDARIAGGNIFINAPIAGDLLVAGGTVSISKEATIGGDLWVAGGVVNFSSEVAGSTKIAGGEILINGTLLGTLDVSADEKLVFGPESNVLGSIKYCGNEEAIIQDGAKVGPIEFTNFDQRGVSKSEGRDLFGMFFFVKLLACFLAGLVVLRLFARKSAEIVSSSIKKFSSNLGIGILGLIFLPIVAFLLMLSVVGSYIGVLILVLFVFLAMLSGVFSVFFLGAILEKWWNRKKSLEIIEHTVLSWKTVLYGVLVGGVLCLIPVIGWLLVALIYFASFGGVLRAFRGRFDL